MQARFSKRLADGEVKKLIQRAMGDDERAWDAFLELQECVYLQPENHRITENQIQMFVQFLEDRSEEGYSYASIMLGSIYEREEWGVVDVKKALKFYRLASEQGESFGQECIAQMYFTGKSVPESEQELFQMLTCGDVFSKGPIALYILAEIYLKSQQNEDHAKAVQFLQAIVEERSDTKALDDYYYKACDKLSELYTYGDGIGRDLKKARYYQEKKERYQRQKPLITLHYLQSIHY